MRKLTNDYANDQNKQNQINLKIHILNYEKIDVPLVNLENSGKADKIELIICFGLSKYKRRLLRSIRR